MHDPGDVGPHADEGSQDPHLVEWAAQIADRIQAGEAVDLDEVTRAQPERAAMLRRLLPAIKMMAALGAGGSSDAEEVPLMLRRREDRPELLGDFELVRELGRGGMGIVYEARQISLGGRRVAVKILSAAAALDPRQMRRFQVEVQAAACLDHDHVVPVYSVGHERGVPFYVMRLIDGRSLAQIIRELRRVEGHETADEEAGDWIGPDAMATTLAYEFASGLLIPEADRAGRGKPDADATTQTMRGESRLHAPEIPSRNDATAPSSATGSSTGDRAYFRTVVQLGVQAAEALDYAHREGILHRDIKPANLLVDLRGHLWVTDFGLARLRGDSELTRTGDLIGTLRYMSPEQALAKRVPIDHRTDVYSLGVTIYEMLTLRPAFGGGDRTQILRSIAEDEPRPPRRLNRRIPRDLETVVLKAMAKEPARRYQTAGDLAEDLGRFLHGLPVLARRTPIWRRVVAWVKTHRTTAALTAAGIAMVLLIASVLSLLQRKEAEFLARRFESASLAELSELIPRMDVTNPAHAACLARMYAGQDPDKKLSAALVLAPTDAGCQDHVLERSLGADPHLLGLLIPLIDRQIPEPLTARLEAEIRREQRPGLSPGEAELRARRQANAACALIALGRDGSAWRLLQSAPDSQARSFLIATLGPAGVKPERLVARLDDPAMSVTTRGAVIQSLADVPESAWRPDVRAGALPRLLASYRDDPDAGAHGAAKWLLLRWGLGPELERMNGELAIERRSDPRFRWRISSEGLTLITVDNPALDRVIEVSDSEVTVDMFKRFNPDVNFSPDISPQGSCPVNGVSYYEAAAFCNWLTGREGLPKEEACYQAGGMDNEHHQVVYRPVAGHRDRGGFRLSTSEEFDIYCAAGTTTRRYHGDSDALFDRYAWSLRNSDGRAHPVASLLPNDLGLFDTLGNVCEWCDSTKLQNPMKPVVADQRGGFASFSPPANLDRFVEFHDVPGGYRHPTQGFRIVRTKKLRQ